MLHWLLFSYFHLFVACWAVYKAFSRISCAYFEDPLFSHLSRGCRTSSFFSFPFAYRLPVSQVVCVKPCTFQSIVNNMSSQMSGTHSGILTNFRVIVVNTLSNISKSFLYIVYWCHFCYIIDQHVYTQIMSIQTSENCFPSGKQNRWILFDFLFISYMNPLPLAICPITRCLDIAT